MSIDVECDKGPKWTIRKPMSFSNIIYGIPHKLQPIFDEFHIKPTYLLSPEVLKDEECVKVFLSLKEKAELGVHMHAEFVEPIADFEANKTDAFQNDYPGEVEFKKIANQTKMFEKIFGSQPKSFRSGRFGLGRNTLFFLERLGYQVDSSVTPFTWWWRRKGEGVNFLGAPEQPYFPSLSDLRRPGKMSILEVPISIINPFWQKFPGFFLRRINPLNRFQTIFLNTFLRSKLRSVWLRPTFSTVDEMILVTKQIIKKAKSKTPVLNMMFHSNEATAGMSPYHGTEIEVDKFLARLKGFLRFIYSKFKVHSMVLSEATQLL